MKDTNVSLIFTTSRMASFGQTRILIKLVSYSLVTMKFRIKILFYKSTRKYPLRGYCLAPPGGGAAEDNIEEKDNSEVKVMVTGYGRTDVRTDVWTERRKV